MCICDGDNLIQECQKIFKRPKRKHEQKLIKLEEGKKLPGVHASSDMYKEKNNIAHLHYMNEILHDNQMWKVFP